MEQKPNKKEELMLANNVLKLAADLLKVTFLNINWFLNERPMTRSLLIIAIIEFDFRNWRVLSKYLAYQQTPICTT